MLEAFARAPLWRHGLNYPHSTGHGIGAGVSAKEGPFCVSGGAEHIDDIQNSPTKLWRYLAPVESGHYLSGGTGVYRSSKFGISLRSNFLARAASFVHTEATSMQSFLRFRCMTPIPFCRTLIEMGMLNAEARCWIDDYHLWCRSEVDETDLRKAGQACLGDAFAVNDDSRTAFSWFWRETQLINTPTSSSDI